MTKILLVEDHPDISDFLSRRLTRRGYDVVVAGDGREGVEKARTEMPDLLLLDLNLPVIDGWKVARTLKDDTLTGHIPIIALTAHVMAGDREKIIAGGCDDYHPKPVDFSRLVEQIESALASRAAGTLG